MTATTTGADHVQDTCVICLSAVSERAVTSCHHDAFDFLCIVSWLNQRSTCPLCKADVTAVTYQHNSLVDFKTYHVRTTIPPPSAPQNPDAHSRHDEAGIRRGRARRRAFSPPNIDIALLRRRHVYRNKLYSLHVGANEISGYQNITPQIAAWYPEVQSRAKMFIRRELRVFSFLYAGEATGAPAQVTTTSSNAEFLLNYIVSILKAVDLKASDGQAENILQEFLGRDNARLFLHELSAWLRSPFAKLEDWDKTVQYREPLPKSFDGEGRPARREKDERSKSPLGGLERGRGGPWRERDALGRHEAG